jgi:hypothetical protein
MIELPLLDLMVCTACELRCCGCTNGMGMLHRLEVFPADEIERDITLAAEVMHAEIAVLLGGEPLGHPELVRLIRFTKASGIADRVRVLTNGIRLHKMPAEFWAEIEDLKVSIYPGKTPLGNIRLAHEMQQEHGFLLSFYDVAGDPFRAVHTPVARNDESAQQTWDGCWYRSNTRKIERGHFWRCCTSASISQTLLGLPPEHDGLPLEGMTTESLAAFLDRPVFMESCRRCHGNFGPWLEQWSEERDKSKWLTVSAA